MRDGVVGHKYRQCNPWGFQTLMHDRNARQVVLSAQAFDGKRPAQAAGRFRVSVMRQTLITRLNVDRSAKGREC